MIKLPRNPLFDVVGLGFLWYQHAVVSGYGMVDDFKLGLKNIGQIFGRQSGGTHEYGKVTRLVDTMDIGNDAAL